MSSSRNPIRTATGFRQGDGPGEDYYDDHRPFGLDGLVARQCPALKASGMDAWTALEKWWKGVPEYTVPVTIKECTFRFIADGVTKVVPFEATYP